jgi:hypothetical protein
MRASDERPKRPPSSGGGDPWSKPPANTADRRLAGDSVRLIDRRGRPLPATLFPTRQNQRRRRSRLQFIFDKAFFGADDAGCHTHSWFHLLGVGAFHEYNGAKLFRRCRDEFSDIDGGHCLAGIDAELEFQPSDERRQRLLGPPDAPTDRPARVAVSCLLTTGVHHAFTIFGAVETALICSSRITPKIYGKTGGSDDG